MKKKTFIVQLLDSKKPSRTSFTQVEDANFYSNDTDASLVFIPHEDSFDFQTAKVVMYNRSDESLVERDAVVTTENGRKVASYELPEEIILHWGEWVAQPVFISGGEIYSGSIVPFSVIRYLMDNRPPTLRDVIKIDELYSQLVAVMDEISDKDVISAPEIILARGGENTLGERLDKEHNEVTTQLAQTKSEAERKRRLEDLDSEVLAAIEGGEGTEFNLLSIPQDYSVTEKKTTFIDISSNMFDIESVVIGHAVDLETGELIPRADYNVTELIETSPDVTFSVYGFNAVVFYDANKNRIGSLFLDYTGGSFVTRPLTKYMRLRYQVANQNTPRQINVGAELLPYEPYGSRLSDNLKLDGKSLEFKSITSDKYADKSVSENAVSFLSKTSNLFDRKKVVTGVVSENGVYDENNSQYVTSDFIPVEPNEVYSHTSLSYIGHYDKNKNFIKRIGYGGSENGENTLNTDATTYFLRGSINTNVTSEESAQINQGNILLPYDNFGYVFNDDIVGINNGKDKIDLWEADPFIIEGITEGFYHGDAMVGYAEPHTITKEQVISWYDNLNPNNKTVLATDDVGNDIYGFEFKSPEVPTAGERRLKERKPKMILVSGFHGLEKAGIFNLYNAMKAITQDWRGNDLLETLRFNVDFIIVPIVNPYGFDNLSRQNENGVDLSRNFPDDWDRASSNPEDITYRGTAPLSEPGARAVSDLLKEHQEDAILFMSHHNYGTDGTFVWNASGTKMQLDLAKKLIGKLSREWQKEHSWLPQEDNWFAGYADAGSPYGSEGRHAAGLGIQGSTFEISHTFPFEDNANQYNEATFTFGIEVMINWLLMNLKENTKFYNSI